jgi:hypothetical protein
MSASHTPTQLEQLLNQAHSLAVALGREHQAELIASALHHVPMPPPQLMDWRP